MDIAHHTLIGGAGYIAAAHMGHEAAGAAFVAGCVLPDLDVLTMAGGRRFYLRSHQGLTHSVVLAPVFALAIYAGLHWLVWAGWPAFASALAGLWVHALLDLLNTFRIAVFAPLSRKRFSLDAVFFIDAFSISLTAGFFALYLNSREAWLSFVYFSVMGAYLVFRLVLRAWVGARLGADFVIPSALNPMGFFALEQKEDGARAYYYDALRGLVREQGFYREVDGKYQDMARGSMIFSDMQRIMRAFMITDVREEDGRVRIEARDLAVRNFGGRFGRTVLEFDGMGRLISEVADI